MGYNKIKIGEIKSRKLAEILHSKKRYAKNLLWKLYGFKGLASDVFVETDDDTNYTATFCICSDNKLVAKYVFDYTTKDADCRKYNAILMEDDIILKRIVSTSYSYNSEEYDKEGHLLAKICDDYETLHVFDWDDAGILKKQVTFMDGRLRRTIKYTYDTKTETYSAEVYGYNDKLIETKTNIPKGDFYRK
jgi:hypothetical protein